MVKEIRVKTGEIAICDDEDYPMLSRFSWFMVGSAKEGNKYPSCEISCSQGKVRFVGMHQLVLGGAINVDHIDLDKFNNQKTNLRIATYQQNGWNKGKARRPGKGKGHTSQYKGVSYRPLKDGKPRWLAMFKHVELHAHKSTGKMVYIGYFDSEIEAAKAYNTTIREYRGEFAWLNPIPEVG